MFNGGLLPAFTVERGVRQGCSLSHLLFALITVPLIHKIGREIPVDKIQPLKLTEGVTLSIVCLADDVALYLNLDEGSVINTFKLLDRIQVASGAKINWVKSRAMILGLNMERPHWLRRTGIQVAECKETIRYLGAHLVTVRRGANEDQNLLSKLTRKAQAFSSPLLTFEARIVALKHAVSAVLVYPMLTSSFKKVFAKCFLQSTVEDLGVRLGTRQVPREFISRPVATLFVHAWTQFMSTVRWDPGNNLAPAGLSIKDAVFLTARREETMEVAGDIAEGISTWCTSLGSNSVRELCQYTRNPGVISLLGDCENEIKILEFLAGSNGERAGDVFVPGEWKTAQGAQLNLDWRGASIYCLLLKDKTCSQGERMNKVWTLNWVSSKWQRIWKIFSFRGLSQRHRIFMWRIASWTFTDGERLKRMNLPNSSCAHCRFEVDFTCCSFLSEMERNLGFAGKELQRVASGGGLGGGFWSASERVDLGT
ncbi:hypothetical protein R1sor_016636 [Riccia sorocarpa]|uniref:Reverse transcriptase domain-containing protein n=1 Tax=Riccia sorocarpa TaxID=122646 RepID=A0ABD3HIW8_9MARC